MTRYAGPRTLELARAAPHPDRLTLTEPTGLRTYSPSDRVKITQVTRFFHQARFGRDHRWSPDHMSAYLDGELAPNGRRRIERHVGECEECRRLLAGLRGIVDALHRLPAPRAGAQPVEVAASVRVRLRDLRRHE